MNIDSLLEQIENILDSGTKITLSKKTAVNAEEIRECIAQLREIIPEEVDQAKSITANRSEIIEKAKSDAAASVARAQEKAQTLVEKTEAKSEQIISAANANAQKTVDSANKLAEETVAKAKSNNMPNDTIERGIKKAAGDVGNVNYEYITYEGYGPGGIAIIVDALTDNKNRTAANVRSAFTKGNGNIGTPGCVSFMFDKKGQIIIDKEEK